MLREHLEAGRPIPTTAKKAAVEGVMVTLVADLERKLSQVYAWRAHCYVAVQAGIWGGKRRLKRRQKLARMIGECAQHLGVPNPIELLPVGWEKHNLFYGHYALEEMSRAANLGRWALSLRVPRTYVVEGRKVKIHNEDEGIVAQLIAERNKL